MSLMAYSQKVESNIDDFTGEKVVKTSWEKIYSGGMTGANQTRLQIQAVNETNFLLFRIYTNEVVAINQGSEVLIKTPNGVIKGIVTQYSVAEPGAWAENAPNNKLGIYFKCSIELADIKDVIIQKIRFPFTDGNLDIEIKDKDNKKIHKMIELISSID